MSLLRHCRGIWAHVSLQNCFNLAALEGFPVRTARLRSCHNISSGFKSGLNLIAFGRTLWYSSSFLKWKCLVDGWSCSMVISIVNYIIQEYSSLNGLRWFSGNSMPTEGHRTCSPGSGKAGDDTVSSEPNKKTVSFCTNGSCGELWSHSALMVRDVAFCLHLKEQITWLSCLQNPFV